MTLTATVSPTARFADLGAGRGHPADHLVAGDERELLAPGADRVDVGVADAAEEDVEGDVAGTRLALLEIEGGDRAFALHRGVAVDGAGRAGGGGGDGGGAHVDSPNQLDS